jgi:uncharacterized protein (DUF1501 family)
MSKNNEDASRIQSRRSLVRLALRTTAVAGLAEMLPPLAFADSVPLERAAVCIYLIGGNDSNNMIVPLDSASFSTYASARQDLALPQAAFLPVNSSKQQASFGFHPFLTQMRDLYQQGSLAVLANTGTLNAPITRDQARAKVGLPDNLFHHERSESYAAFLPNASMMPPWAPAVQPPDEHDPGTQDFVLGGVSMISPRRLLISGPLRENPVLIDAIRRTHIRTPFPGTQLGGQLFRIARLLKASSRFGLRRPIFSATMAGFDTHLDQGSQQEQLFGDLSQAMAAFYAATQELGLADQVVTYTQTEFNRTLRPNRMHGTEHAWGGHELIMGGSVRGGDIYGTFPSLELGGPDDAGTDGIWVPTTGSQQLESTVAYWHGVASGNMTQAIQGLENFPSSNLGFLG